MMTKHSSVSRADFAKLLGISPQSVSEAIDSGRIETDLYGNVINPAEQAEQFKGPGRPRSDPSNPSAAKAFQEARAVREEFRAKLARLQYEKEIGSLVSREDAEFALSDIVLRAKIGLDTLPNRLAAELLGVTDHGVAHARAKALINGVIEEMHRNVLAALAEIATAKSDTQAGDGPEQDHPAHKE